MLLGGLYVYEIFFYLLVVDILITVFSIRVFPDEDTAKLSVRASVVVISLLFLVLSSPILLTIINNIGITSMLILISITVLLGYFDFNTCSVYLDTFIQLLFAALLIMFIIEGPVYTLSFLLRSIMILLLITMFYFAFRGVTGKSFFGYGDVLYLSVSLALIDRISTMLVIPILFLITLVFNKKYEGKGAPLIPYFGFVIIVFGYLASYFK